MIEGFVDGFRVAGLTRLVVATSIAWRSIRGVGVAATRDRLGTEEAIQ